MLRPPFRFSWMEIAAAVIIVAGAYGLSVMSTPPEKTPQQASAAQTVTR